MTFVLIIVFIPGVSLGQPRKSETASPMQLMRLKRITGVQVSPDGKRVVYAVREAVLADGKSEYLSHIHVANADGTGTLRAHAWRQIV